MPAPAPAAAVHHGLPGGERGVHGALEAVALHVQIRQVQGLLLRNVVFLEKKRRSLVAVVGDVMLVGFWLVGFLEGSGFGKEAGVLWG